MLLNSNSSHPIYLYICQDMKNQHDLTEVVQGHIQAILKRYDKDNNSSLDKEELRQLLADNLGTTPDKITQDQLDWHFAKIDENSDGKITFDEYFYHFFASNAKNAKKKIQDDKKQKGGQGDNEDQLIDQGQFRKLMEDTFRPLAIKITDDMVKWNFSQIDKDNSGRIQFDEFLKFIKKYNQ